MSSSSTKVFGVNVKDEYHNNSLTQPGGMGNDICRDLKHAVVGE